MRAYFIFFALCVVLFFIADMTRKLGYKNLKVYRKLDKYSVFQNESFDVTIFIENNKWLPVSFLCVSEGIPASLRLKGDNRISKDEKIVYHTTKYNILWYERIKRTYTVIGDKRGTYLLRDMKMTLGDIFGFAARDMEVEDYIEVLVKPKIMEMNSIDFDNKSLMGDNIVKRWLYKDSLYIKGIREYSVEDRLKDIHWKSSLKMNKLMVKDYDYTSDNEIVVITNVQVSDQVWEIRDTEIIEEMISLSVSIAAEALKNHIPTGFWTNAFIRAYSNEYKSEIEPSMNSYKGIMELGARMDTNAKAGFYEYLFKRVNTFRKNCVYILVTAFLDESSINLLYRLKKHGINILLIDASKKGELKGMRGIERVTYRGEKAV